MEDGDTLSGILSLLGDPGVESLGVGNVFYFVSHERLFDLHILASPGSIAGIVWLLPVGETLSGILSPAGISEI